MTIFYIIVGIVVGFQLIFIFKIRKENKEAAKNSKVKNISGKEAHELLKRNPHVLVLDTRNEKEFNKGHVKKARNIPAHLVEMRIQEISAFKKKPVLVYCSSGGRSVIVVKKLLNNGFSNIYNMENGLKSYEYELEK